MRVKRLFRKVSPHRAVFSFPEVRWQFTKPNEVPLNMKETPTAPLFPVRTTRKKAQVTLGALPGLPSAHQSGSGKVHPTPPPPMPENRQAPQHTPTPSPGIPMGHRLAGRPESVCMCEQSPWRYKNPEGDPTDSGQISPREELWTAN